MLVAEVASARTRLHHRDVGLLGNGLECVPSLAVEDAGTGHDDRAFRLGDHACCLGDFLGRRMGTRLGAVLRLVVEEAQILSAVEALARHLARKVQMNRSRNAGLELAEGIAGIFVHALGVDEALAVLLHALGGRLLVDPLDAVLGVLQPQRHVASQHQQRRARRVGGGDVHDHVREAGPFGARCRHDLAGHAGEAVRSGAHHAFGAAAVAGNALRRDGVDHDVVARGAEQRGQSLGLAGLGEDLCPCHREVGRLGIFREARRHFARDLDVAVASLGGRCRRFGAGRYRSRHRPLGHESAPRHGALRLVVLASHGLSPPVAVWSPPRNILQGAWGRSSFGPMLRMKSTTRQISPSCSCLLKGGISWPAPSRIDTKISPSVAP